MPIEGGPPRIANEEKQTQGTPGRRLVQEECEATRSKHARRPRPPHQKGGGGLRKNPKGEKREQLLHVETKYLVGDTRKQQPRRRTTVRLSRGYRKPRLYRKALPANTERCLRGKEGNGTWDVPLMVRGGHCSGKRGSKGALQKEVFVMWNQGKEKSRRWMGEQGSTKKASAFTEEGRHPQRGKRIRKSPLKGPFSSSPANTRVRRSSTCRIVNGVRAACGICRE